MQAPRNEEAMRIRMEARGRALAASNTGTVPLSHTQPLVSVQHVQPFIPYVPAPCVQLSAPTAAASEWIEAVAHAMQDPPPQIPRAPTSSSVQTLERCKSLKERIGERAASASACSASDLSFRVSELTFPEPTRDVYAHAMPFPPTAVYEVERVAVGTSGVAPLISPPSPVNYGNPQEILRHMGRTRLIDTRDDNSKGVLLMATECAAVVRDFQAQLEAERRKCLDLSDLLRKAQAELSAEKDARDCAQREGHQWSERHAALEAVYQLEKRQWVEALATERQVGVTANNEAVGSVVAEHRSLVEVAQLDAMTQKRRADKLLADNERLEHVLRELKEHMATNAAIATTSGGTVDRLTKELLLAKQQATFISTGYKKQDSELRALREQVASQSEELVRYRAMAAEQAILVAQRDDANLRLEAMHAQVAENPRLRAELTSLRDAHARLTVDFEEKASKAAELKEILDDIRKQANNAYVQTMGFNTMADATSPGRGDVSLQIVAPNASQYSAEIERLRQEIESEQRRAEDEKRRWHGRNH